MSIKEIVVIPERYKNLKHVAIGRVVHYVLPNWINGECVIRPALVVAVRDDETVNLQVLVDGPNDETARGPHSFGTLTDWVTDAKYDAGESHGESDSIKRVYDARTWHWPERV